MYTSVLNEKKPETVEDAVDNFERMVDSSVKESRLNLTVWPTR